MEMLFNPWMTLGNYVKKIPVGTEGSFPKKGKKSMLIPIAATKVRRKREERGMIPIE